MSKNIIKLTESRLKDIIKKCLYEAFNEDNILTNDNKVDYSNKMYHKASPFFRQKIKREGLIPQVGDSYSAHWDDATDLIPGVFLYDINKQEYDTTYDDDIWEVDTTKLNKNYFIKDPDEYMYETFGSVLYRGLIQPYLLKLVKKGSIDKN